MSNIPYGELMRALLEARPYGGRGCERCKYKKVSGPDRCGMKGCVIMREAAKQLFEVTNALYDTV